MEQRNEVMYSFYQALIQSMNMFAPYGNSNFSQDVFYMGFPALRLFHAQLNKVLEKQNSKELSAEVLEKLIFPLKSFLDDFDPTLYRSIHAEQTFLMVPGYGGVLYTIPSKLSLMYMAFLRAVIRVLNDWEVEKKNRFIYECILSPVVNSKPVTGVIDFTLAHDERLVEVKISQKCLFSPNLMCVILAHEMGHYVGERKRNRGTRLRYLCFILGTAIANAIFDIPTDIPFDDIKEFLSQCDSEKIRLAQYLIAGLQQYIEEDFEEKKNNGENDYEEYYFSSVSKSLIKNSRVLLQEHQSDIKKLYMALNKNSVAYIDKEPEKRAERLKNLKHVFQCRKENVRRLMREGYIDKLVSKMRTCFKETYADLLALVILYSGDAPGNIFEDYLKAFFLSEGVDSAVDPENVCFINRVAAVINVLTNKKRAGHRKWEIKWGLLSKQYKTPDKMKEIVNNTNRYIEARRRSGGQKDLQSGILTQEFYCWNWDPDVMINSQVVWDKEEQYLSECLDAACWELKQKERDGEEGAYLKEIRQLYRMLKGGPEEKWMQAFDEIIFHYEDDINHIIRQEIQKGVENAEFVKSD